MICNTEPLSAILKADSSPTAEKSSLRKGLGETVSHKTLFKAYETKLLPNQEKEIKQLIDLTNQNERIALACFEADHHFCLRHTLTEHLQKNKSFKRAVIHL
ncbi:MAG: DUF488 family protein [Chloroflexi bacterium]|nr:DUF488 family protein [Chloroflexota bacterium]